MKFFGKSKDLATDVAVGSPTADPTGSENADEKHAAAAVDGGSLDRIPSPDVQDGVKKVEAVTLVWTRKELIFAYAW